MVAISRRKAVGTLIICGLAATSSGIASGAFAQARITIPSRPMVLSRRLERPLRDGALIIAEREWRIEFSQQGRGFAVRGQQLSSHVTAPPELASLAQIEEGRSTDGMWPILLNAAGLVAAAGEHAMRSDLADAKRAALQMFEQRGVSDAALSSHREQLEIVAGAGSSLLDRLPEDLFFPRGQDRKRREVLDLPGGVSGEFAVTYTAVATSEGWLQQALREVTTTIGESESSAREYWALSAA